jgi:UvrD/REP helicase N-terminal domain
MIAALLSGEALPEARDHRSHLQIIGSTGFGETAVVVQRFAQLMAADAGLAGIIAFTFTDRAAQGPKARISAHITERIGPHTLDSVAASMSTAARFVLSQSGRRRCNHTGSGGVRAEPTARAALKLLTGAKAETARWSSYYG